MKEIVTCRAVLEHSPFVTATSEITAVSWSGNVQNASCSVNRTDRASVRFQRKGLG